MTIHEPLAKLLGEIFDETRDVDDAAVHARKRDEFVFHILNGIGIRCEPVKLKTPDHGIGSV